MSLESALMHSGIPISQRRVQKYGKREHVVRTVEQAENRQTRPHNRVRGRKWAVVTFSLFPIGNSENENLLTSLRSIASLSRDASLAAPRRRRGFNPCNCNTADKHSTAKAIGQRRNPVNVTGGSMRNTGDINVGENLHSGLGRDASSRRDASDGTS